MRKVIFSMLTVLTAAIMGCETSTPNSAAQRTALREEANANLQRMEAQDPTLRDKINNAYGYVVFPEIGEGALVIGGAGGRGEAYRNGQLIGHVTLKQAEIGPKVGGETYGELIIFQDEKAFNRLTNNSFEFGADAKATLLKAGAAAATEFAHGTQVYVMSKGGLMAGISLNGQKFHFHPSNETHSTETTTTTPNQP